MSDSDLQTANFYVGDAKEALQTLPAESVQTCITSPPYWGLRDYGEDGQLGLEETPQEYVQNLVEVFREVWRVLTQDGTLWLNLGDSYMGSGPNRQGESVGADGEQNGRGRDTRGAVGSLKEKDLVGIPWRVALALQDDGWWLRSDIIWNKPNPMPESVTDRPTSSHEHIFLLSKSKQYYYDTDAIREDAERESSGNTERRYEQNRDGEDGIGHSIPWENDGDGRNKRDVWTVSTKPYPEAHFAVYPPDLIEPCVSAGSEEGDTVFDPFAGAGTTGLVALAKGRDFIGIDLSEEYCEMAAKRIRKDAPLMNNVEICEPVYA